jgi:hypothetical protein
VLEHLPPGVTHVRQEVFFGVLPADTQPGAERESCDSYQGSSVGRGKSGSRRSWALASRSMAAVMTRDRARFHRGTTAEA